MQKNIEDGVSKTITVGTQILRTASNADKFCQSVKNTFGLEIKILSHQDEAFYLYK
jgi:exopolyphosphatase/pppGpp-phosphohydrolase